MKTTKMEEWNYECNSFINEYQNDDPDEKSRPGGDDDTVSTDDDDDEGDIRPGL